MTWWTLTHLANTRSWTALYTLAATNVEDHLSMAWSHHKPARRGIYRVIRGKLVLCGYRYVWDTPIILQQEEAGDTYWHTFNIHYLRSDQHVWYYLFAPDGPYGLEIQGPLIHIPPPEVHLWTTTLYVGTHLKGVFYTDTFTGPGGDHPVWRTRNFGLHSLKIWHLEPDPLGATYRFYCIAGDPGSRKVYKREPPLAEQWFPILTNAQACTLTGSGSGEICWVSTNTNFPGYLYVLFNSALTTNGTWCLVSTDYGVSWNAFQITATALNYDAGNLGVGIAQGSSPYDPGTVLYAPICDGPGQSPGLYLSLDHGQTWALRDLKGISVITPRCLVDPTDQAIVYTGSLVVVLDPFDLFRSEEHGANLLQVDADYHLGIVISPSLGALWINPTDHSFLINLRYPHLYVSIDYCLSWSQGPPMQKPVSRLALLWEQPTLLYLARHDSAPPPPDLIGQHVIYVSQTSGVAMEGKAGANCALPDGGGDSIPYNCGGVCLQGLMLLPPS